MTIKLKLKEFEILHYAIEVEHKAKRGRHHMISDEIRDERKYKNDMQFEISLPDGQIERKYITRKRLEEIGIIQFKVKRERLYE
jgi:hypothetical protein